MKASERLREVPSYPFVHWNEACRKVASRGIEVIRLDMGNPDLAPPEPVIDALCLAAHDAGSHGYPGFRGRPELRKAIAGYYARRFGVELDPTTQVVPLLGSKEGIVNLSLACLNPGDVALIPDPGYAPYARGALLAEAEPVFFPLIEDNGFLPDLDAIPTETARRASLLWLNYPNNPTGACANLNFLSKAIAFARTHDILLCHDAPYADIAYDDCVPPSILEIPGSMDVAIELNSISKTFNMAGWRVGMAVGNPAALALLAQLKSNSDSGIFLPIQAAATQALQIGSDWIEARNAVYRERLSLVVEAIRRAGLQADVPQATLYLWIKLPTGASSERVALYLLETTGISVAPGVFFGPSGEGHLRISVTSPTEQIAAAAERLGELPTDWLSLS